MKLIRSLKKKINHFIQEVAVRNQNTTIVYMYVGYMMYIVMSQCFSKHKSERKKDRDEERGL